MSREKVGKASINGNDNIDKNRTSHLKGQDSQSRANFEQAIKCFLIQPKRDKRKRLA